MSRGIESSDAVWLWVGSVCFAIVLAFCTPAETPKVPTLELAEQECVGYRTLKQIACDAEFQTRAEIDACREGVKVAVDCTDGGALLFVKDSGGER